MDTGPALAQAVEDDFVAVWQSFGDLPEAELHEGKGWSQLITGRPYALLNAVLRWSLDEQPAATALDEALSRFAAHDVPFTVWVLPSGGPGLPELLADRGLHEGEPWPGMAAELHALTLAGPTPDGLSIDRLADPAAFATFRGVAQAVFGQDELWDALDRLIAQQGLAAAGFEHFVGRVDGNPVATASVAIDGPVAGVYNIATLPGVRGRGIGTAMTERVLRHGLEHGATIAVLQSSPAGERIYRGLGFREVCRLRPFYGP